MLTANIGRGITLSAEQHNNGRWCLKLNGLEEVREIARSLPSDDMLRAFALFVGQPAQEGKLKDIAKKFKRSLKKDLSNRHAKVQGKISG